MKQYKQKSFATKAHEQLAEARKEKRRNIKHGEIFYHVMILAIGRVWKDRILRVKQDPDDFVVAVCLEMLNIFSKPGDYEAMCYEETGITLEKNDED